MRHPAAVMFVVALSITASGAFAAAQSAPTSETGGPRLRLTAAPRADVTRASLGGYDTNPNPTGRSPYRFLVHETCSAFPCTLHPTAATTVLWLYGPDGATRHHVPGLRAAGVGIVHRSVLLRAWAPVLLAGLSAFTVGGITAATEGFSDHSILPGGIVTGVGISVILTSVALYLAGVALRWEWRPVATAFAQPP